MHSKTVRLCSHNSYLADTVDDFIWKNDFAVGLASPRGMAWHDCGVQALGQ